MEGEVAAPLGAAGAEAILETCRRAVNLATFAAASGGVKRAPEVEAEEAEEAGLAAVESFPGTGRHPIHQFSALISESVLSTR